MFPSKDELTICFAHVAYRLRERFLTLATGIESFEVRDVAALERQIGEADVLVISGLWRNISCRARSGCVSSSRSVPAPTSSRASRSSSTACGSRAPAASIPARSPSTLWH